LRRQFGLGFKVWIQGVIGRERQKWTSTAMVASGGSRTEPLRAISY
jgi:hypothetical protein